MRKSFLLVLGALLIAAQAEAKLKLPALVGDHMVLQKGLANVWGWADPGETVTVSMAGKSASAKAGEDGQWKASLKLLRAGGPFELTISTPSDAVTVQDVLVGEVWVGSGQSNMEFATKTSSDADKEIPAANFPQIRLFTVEKTASLKPLDDVKGSWKVCSPDTVPDFSAVAYYFGKELHRALKVPVGLIEAAWGGSSAESWTPRENLDKDKALSGLVESWSHNDSQIKSWTTGDDVELDVSDIRILPKDPKDKPLTVLVQPGSSGLGGAWSCSVKPGCQGSVTVEGKAFSGKGPAVKFTGLMMGGGWGTLSANFSPGVDLGRYQSVEFYAKGKGKYTMTLGQPSIGDYDYYAIPNAFDAPATWQKITCDITSLKQGGWGAPKPFTPDSIISLNFPVQVPYWPDLLSVLYNGMTAPMTNCSIRGVLWYQGESNAGRAGQYHGLMTDLITGWREAWGRTFPFLIIQLPNYMPVKDEPSESGWAELREAQLQTSETVPDTGLITTIDLGVANNIHPTDKTDVGHRAALAALGRVYHKKITYSGPIFHNAKVMGEKMLLRFAETGKGLATKDGGPVTGFALSGEDGEFHWAQAKITGLQTLSVWCDAVKKPVEVRYAWADNPICNLMNKEGLMASPFRYSTLPGGGHAISSHFETWKTLDSSNAGSYQDGKGSKLTFETVEGPKAGEKALHLTFDLKDGGYCGLWHNVAGDLSKFSKLVFQAKASLPGEVQIALKDKWNVQYIARASVPSKDWTEVKVPLSSFAKDTTYTPPEAQLGHPMDLSSVSGLNFGPQPTGQGELWIGPVSGE